MSLSDQIARYILQLMYLEDDGEVKLSRKQLAEEIGCVPSQINYVLDSRFSPKHGYLVESKRGGGGYIIIKQIFWSDSCAMIMHTINSIGDFLDECSSKIILENLLHREILTVTASNIMSAALSNQSYSNVPNEFRENLRANMIKQMLVSFIQT